MKNLRDGEIGKRYGRLVILREAKRRRHSGNLFRMVECVCDCGNKKIIRLSHLCDGATKSCGCLCREKTGLLTKTHGKSYTRIFQIWGSMKSRCFNKNNHGYIRYGGRGIGVCDRWLKFENFYRDMGEVPDGMTLDRIDNNGNYCKENCRWATKKEQANNRRTNRILEYRNKKYTLAELSNKYNISSGKIWKRLKLGWDIKDALEVE
jgi:hypothetical protein